jgi:hypothetical protein
MGSIRGFNVVEGESRSELGGRWVFELPLAQTLVKFVDRRSGQKAA